MRLFDIDYSKEDRYAWVGRFLITWDSGELWIGWYDSDHETCL